MTLPGSLPSAQPPSPTAKKSFLRRIFGRKSKSAPASQTTTGGQNGFQGAVDEFPKPGLIRRMSRRVVPGLPRQQTFKRQQSEQRTHLAPVEQSAEERRAGSIDRRSHFSNRTSRQTTYLAHINPRASARSIVGENQGEEASQYTQSLPADPLDHVSLHSQSADAVEAASTNVDAPDTEEPVPDVASIDAVSMTTSQYHAKIQEELEKIWILNLSMHFRDRSHREKFFVTYRQHEHLWRRVTLSLDYRDAPLNSLEMELDQTKLQREKSAKIYEAIRDSLEEIQFYDTVTNLKLETTDGRLHVHVVEDGNEIIQYPTVSQIRHLGCRRVKERDIVFDSHMSGFVYKVSVKGNVLIKKEIPSPDTVEEFLYEVNALNNLRFSNNIISFYGVVVDDQDETVKGLLISYADQGALVDIIYDTFKEKNRDIPWDTREKWARQIIQGLADVHESGFVQGDFTLSNIVIDAAGDAKIIDINRRGCPVGWEPPEATVLIEANQRLSMYIGVKSDLYQLGMVLWGLAMMEDEPEAQGRPLILGPEIIVPDWYRRMTEICLSDDPRMRMQASSLLHMFPPAASSGARGTMQLDPVAKSMVEDQMLRDYTSDGYNNSLRKFTRTVEPDNSWAYSVPSRANFGWLTYDPPRGRSPPSSLPIGFYDRESLQKRRYSSGWAANRNITPSYSDSGRDTSVESDDKISRQPSPTSTVEHSRASFLYDPHIRDQSRQGFRQDAELPIDLMTGQAKQAASLVPETEREKGADGYVENDPEILPEHSTSIKPSTDIGDFSARKEQPRAEENALPELPTNFVGIAQPYEGEADASLNIETPEIIISTVQEVKYTDRSDSAVDVRPVAKGFGDTDKDVSEDQGKAEAAELSKARGIEDGDQTPTPKATHKEIEPKMLNADKNDWRDRLYESSTPREEEQQDVESEPEYIASKTPPIFTTTNDAGEIYTNSHETENTKRKEDTEAYWAKVKDASPGEAKPPNGYMCPRHASVPMVLTGIGAAHEENDERVIPEKGILDDDFQLTTRPDTAPTLMMTTDTKT